MTKTKEARQTLTQIWRKDGQQNFGEIVAGYHGKTQLFHYSKPEIFRNQLRANFIVEVRGETSVPGTLIPGTLIPTEI